MHLRERKISCLPPYLDITLNCRCPEEIGALGRFWAFIALTWNVHVITSAAMLGAVSTSQQSADDHRDGNTNTEDKMPSKEERRLIENLEDTMQTAYH
jgi:hypothetical protein